MKHLQGINTTLSDKAKVLAAQWHADTNHMYDDYLPYAYHLNMVGQIAKHYIFLIPKRKRDVVLAACYLHDSIEDARKTYNDVAKSFGIEVADLVFAVTNNTGKTRAERADVAYYQKIRDTEFAVFVKLCDRFANILHGILFGGSMIQKYRKEHEHFAKEVWDERFHLMFIDLKTLMYDGTIRFAVD